MDNNTLQLEMFPQTTRERLVREFASDGVLFHPEDDIGIADFVERSAAPNGWLNQWLYQYMLRKAIEMQTERESQNSRRFAYALDRIAKFKIRITETLKFKRSYVKA